MRKLKQPANKPTKPTPSLGDFLESYDIVTLHTAASSFESSIGWELMKAYAALIQRDYEVKALDKLGTGESNQVAAYASGYAKACEDLFKFTEGLRQTILGRSQVVENPRPQE